MAYNKLNTKRLCIYDNGSLLGRHKQNKASIAGRVSKRVKVQNSNYK